MSEGKGGTLPNGPYKDASDAVLFVWRPARWANWMFNQLNYTSDKGTASFGFGHGGFQVRRCCRCC